MFYELQNDDVSVADYCIENININLSNLHSDRELKMAFLPRSTLQARHCAQPLSSWCVSLNAGDGFVVRRWMSGQKVEHEGEDMPNFDVRVSVIVAENQCEQRLYDRLHLRV